MRLYLHTQGCTRHLLLGMLRTIPETISRRRLRSFSWMVDIYICEKLVLVVRLTTIIPASPDIANLCVCAHKTLKNYQNLFL